MTYFAGNKEINLLYPEAHKIFRRMVESIKVGAFMADARGNLFFVNPAFVTIFGYASKDDILGLNWSEQVFIFPQEKENFFREMDLRGFVRDFEINVKNKNLEKIVLAATCSYLRNEKGETIGLQGVVHDVTMTSRLEEDLRTEKMKLEQILEFNETINTIRDSEDLVRYIVEKSSQILTAEKCSLMLLDEAAHELTIKSARGLSEEVISSTRVKLGEQISGRIAQTDKGVLVRNIDYDNRFDGTTRSGYKSRSFISAAIRKDNKLIGVLNVTDKTGGVPFTDLDLRILEAIIRQAAVAIENSKIYQELEYLSTIDPLTNLRNYRAFVRTLDQEINRLKRFSGSLSLLMIDVDNFKFINDTRGHMAGDNLLRGIGEIFKNNLRDFDTICRYGGDEFAVILPETTAEQARIVAEKLRQRVEDRFANEKVSLSIGITEYVPSLNRNDLVQIADKALYEAKRGGKNRISMAN